MEALAEAYGDLEQLVAVMSRDRSTAYDFLKIAHAYRDAGRPDVALEWAERGWREATEGGCSEDLWLRLARLREKDHPADSIQIYRDRVSRLLGHTGNRVYEEAVEYLERIGGLMIDSKRETDFRNLVAEIRTTHRRKRNLLGMLDGKGW
jgi:uncharacterized Zn finger protein